MHNIKKWVVMYPVYMNSKKTVAEGRRISLSKACENPNCIEISDCCKHLKLNSAVEVKILYLIGFKGKFNVFELFAWFLI